MTTAEVSTFREVDERIADAGNVIVRWFYSPVCNTHRVEARDRQTGSYVQVETHSGGEARHVFAHPPWK